MKCFWLFYLRLSFTGFVRDRMVRADDQATYLDAELLPPMDTHPRFRALIRCLLTIDASERPSPREARVGLALVSLSVVIALVLCCYLH